MTLVVIPVRSFRLGKQRLADTLASDQRESLGRALATRVVSAVREAGADPLIVTGDGDVAAWAENSEVKVEPDSGTGLDGAAVAGVRHAARSGEPWMVLHSDLPLVTSGDLTRLLAPIDERQDVIAPSADGGTTAVSSSGSLEFSYGPGSFHRHLAQLSDPVVVTAVGLLHDLDSPLDLEAARHHTRGDWLAEGVY